MTPLKQSGRDFFQGDWGRLEQIIERFESAWQRGERPAIDAYLRAEDAKPKELARELVHADLECRLRAGEAIRVESYLERFTDLAADRAVVLRLIEAEYRLRQRREPGLDPAEYARRFPDLRPDLAQQLPAPHQLPSWVPPRLNCPHCHKSVALDPDDTFLEIIPCPSCGQNFPPAIEPPPASSADGVSRLGQFELLEAVGQGAFGTVYRARDTRLDRMVAVKVPRRDRTPTPADVDRFLREARNAARLNHPGIVPVYEVGQAGTVPYIVTAFIAGVTLAETLTRERPEFREAAEIIAQTAEALDHAHRHGVVHRDLKPSNVMLGQIEGSGVKGQRSEELLTPHPSPLTPSRTVFVMDFGLARREEGEARLTLEGQILGTPAYMSPEQARGQAHGVDGRGDVYSLGVILYELLTGELPFRGVTRMVLQQILQDEPRPPRQLNDRIPRDLETVALKCLAKEPGRRYATAGDLAADLRRHLDGHPVLARPVGRLERARRWARRNPRVAFLSAAVVGLLVLIAAGSSAAALVIAAKKQEAEENAQRANRRNDLALDAYDKLVTEVQDQLEHQPATLKLRENLLHTALAGLERLAKDAARDQADIRLVTAHRRLGELYLILGRPNDACTQFAEGRLMAETLAAASPGDARSQEAVCTLTVKLAEANLRAGATAAARQECEEALLRAGELARTSLRRPEAVRILFVTNDAAGKVYQKLGDLPRAVACHQLAVERARELYDAEPENWIAQLNLASMLTNLGDARLAQNQLTEAGAAFDRALDLYVRCAAAQPGNPTIQSPFARAYARVGSLAIRRGQPRAAEGPFRNALTVCEQLVAADPYNPLYRRGLSLAHCRLGEVCEQLREPAAAVVHYRRALERFEELEATNPTDPGARRDVAAMYRRLGTVLRDTGDNTAAREYFRKAEARWEELLQADRDDVSTQIGLGDACNAAGLAALEVHDYAEAIPHFERGIAVLASLETQGKLQPVYNNWLSCQRRRLKLCQQAVRAMADLNYALAQPPEVARQLLVTRASALADHGRHVEAAEAAEWARRITLRVHILLFLNPVSAAAASRCADLPTPDGMYLYDTACCYALCAAGVAPGKPLDRLAPEESQTRERYLHRALRDLADAVKVGFDDPRRLESDPDLVSLRGSAEYWHLVEQVRKASDPPKTGS